MWIGMRSGYCTTVKMSQDVKSLRSWQELAKLTAEQKDPTNVLELAQQLIRALDEESRKSMDQISAAEKSSEKRTA